MQSAQDYQECREEDIMAEEVIGGVEVLYFLQCLESQPAPILDMVSQCTVLELADNSISQIPSSIDRCINVKKINLTGNKLIFLPWSFYKLKNLTHLNLSLNNFRELPASVCALPHIEVLNLRGNNLRTLPPDFRVETMLKRLNLEKILGFMHHAEDRVSGRPSDVSNMTSLKSLDVSTNAITHLPYQLASLTLHDLNVTGNPMQQPPMSVCKEGKEAIFRYLTEIRESKTIASCRIQLNLLGETGSGKTSLARSLRLGIPMLTEEADRTRVVEQSLWEIEEDVSFNINDFGGHDVYRVGHCIFISQNSIVLVTFDLSTYDPCSSSDFSRHIGIWIDMVQSHNPKATIALVGTHLDKTDEWTREVVCASILEAITDERIIRQQLCERQKIDLSERIQSSQENKNEYLVSAYTEKIKSLETTSAYGESRIYPHIFMVSSKTQEGLRPLIVHLATQAKGMGVSLPQTWHEAAKTIYAKKENKIECTLCRENIKQDIENSVKGFINKIKFFWRKPRQRTDNDVNDILAFLANRGEIIWYASRPILRNTIFHRQEVIADLLKAVLNHNKSEFEFLKQMIVSEPMAERIREDFSKRGILSMQAMEALWKPFRVTAREASAMVELMQRLELCFKVNDGKYGATFHFPWLLKQSRPPIMDTKWPQLVPQDTTQLTLNVYFPYRCPDAYEERLERWGICGHDDTLHANDQKPDGQRLGDHHCCPRSTSPRPVENTAPKP
ncbi:malignant fibrous histiocytoma-amplified sequence 1 homolog [Lingula anatina]|uniref:Malignant fibrous histiocytoma-amplified sequence 1 homolog n=1 Tax=Lingula anatina TaxID=7574 RepID=A0A1S3I600_LINAN|nr:malignant fibrous histiocytoma-amplified sequence 1 homolog [Lingula anatina]|eukprot:XP_013393633.1 malignant fibrous histiocytoma-amplified sequence 1 homolog [Lingula anatina]